MRSKLFASAAILAIAGLTACSETSTEPELRPAFAYGTGTPTVGAVVIPIVSDNTVQKCGFNATFAPVAGTVFAGSCAAADDLSGALAAYNPGWPVPPFPAVPSAHWIGAQGDANQYTVLPGAYKFEKTFTLPAGATSQLLNLSIRADNVAIVYLNGIEVGRHTPTADNPVYWNTQLALTDAANFVTGTNTLRVDLVNTTMGYPSANNCALGPQDFGTNSSGAAVATPQSIVKGWVIAECRNPSAVSFTGAAYYLPATIITGGQGCSHGFWKNKAFKTPNQWLVAGFAANGSTTLGAAGFVVPNQGGPTDATTMIAALNFNGGSGVVGAQQILLRNAVASLLNSKVVAYPLTPAQVISQVNAALATNDRDTMLALEAQLDVYNNLHNARICPN